MPYAVCRLIWLSWSKSSSIKIATLVLGTTILFVGGMARANAAGPAKASPNMLCITCTQPPPRPYPISGTLEGASTSAMVNPEYQTVTGTITSPSGIVYSTVLNVANHTIEVWTPKSHVELYYYQENGSTYVELYVSSIQSGQNAESQATLSSNGGGIQPLIQNVPGNNCSAEYDDDGDWIAGDPNCMTFLEQLEGYDIALDYGWMNDMIGWWQQDGAQTTSCLELFGGAYAATLSAILTKSPKLSAVLIFGGFVGGASGFFDHAYNGCFLPSGS